MSERERFPRTEGRAIPARGPMKATIYTTALFPEDAKGTIPVVILDAEDEAELRRDAALGVLARMAHAAEQKFQRLLEDDAPARWIGRERAAPETLAAEKARDEAREALQAALAAADPTTGGRT